MQSCVPQTVTSPETRPGIEFGGVAGGPGTCTVGVGAFGAGGVVTCGDVTCGVQMTVHDELCREQQRRTAAAAKLDAALAAHGCGLKERLLAGGQGRHQAGTIGHGTGSTVLAVSPSSTRRQLRSGCARQPH